MAADPESDPWTELKRLPMGSRVEVHQVDGAIWRGTLLPPHELSGERVVRLKMESGYNVGLTVGPTDRFHLLPSESSPTNGTPPPPPHRTTPPGRDVVVLTTGGTIASRVDYRTGGVKPVREESEILAFYPDLSREGPVRVVPVVDRLSEDITPEDWSLLARRVGEAFDGGARGVVIAHGTDTLAFTAAALSFLLESIPGPVVLVGAQRSPDRPSSDGPTNLAAAVRIARSADLGEVVVVMQDGLSDDRFAIHRGTRVRKMHSSRRDAFQSRNSPPLGYLDASGIQWNVAVRPAAPPPARVDARLNPHGGLLWFYPGLTPERASSFTRGLRGVVLAGTGLGHVSASHLPWIREAVGRGVVVVMTTQCLDGEVDPYVYATGRELLRAGVLYAGDLLPETAYVKLLWALAHADGPDELRHLMETDRAGEFEPRHLASEHP
jgi:glutamyl-tRNA(Gln) amidotransferase subunit D